MSFVTSLHLVCHQGDGCRHGSVKPSIRSRDEAFPRVPMHKGSVEIELAGIPSRLLGPSSSVLELMCHYPLHYDRVQRHGSIQSAWEGIIDYRLIIAE